MKRLVLRLRWNKKLGEWQLLNSRGEQIDLSHDGLYSKAAVESLSRAHCRELYKERQVFCQLVIHNKNGQIQKGNTGEATYGRDPKRSKG